MRALKYTTFIALSVTMTACSGPFHKHSPSHMPYGYYPAQSSHNPAYTPVRGYPTRGSRPVAVNYEALNAFEAPLAFEAANTTFLLRGRVDTPLEYSLENKGKVDGRVIGNYQLSAETQLRNRITLGAAYGGRYESVNGDDYTDNVAAFAGGSWGTVFGGNVADLVFEETRRLRGVTPVRLAGDGALGTVNRWSGGYRGRYGPVIVSTLVDEDKNYDVGVSLQRPIGVKDYRFTARHNNGQLVAADGITTLDTKSVSGVAEYIYGSSRFDLGAGYEKIEDADRWFTSAGATTKSGAWSASIEGLYGEIEGQEEISAVLGVRRDLARGLAATAALDYEDRQIAINGVNFINNKDTRVTVGLSYGF